MRASWAIFQKPSESKMGTLVEAIDTSMVVMVGVTLTYETRYSSARSGLHQLFLDNPGVLTNLALPMLKPQEYLPLIQQPDDGDRHRQRD